MNTSMVTIALEGARLNALLIAAIEKKLCDLLKIESCTVPILAEKANISVRGCQALADGMVGMRLWTVENSLYKNSKLAERMLCSDSADYIGIEHVFLFKHWVKIFAEISDFVVSGKPAYPIDSPETLEFWAQLTPAIAKNGQVVVNDAIDRFNLGNGKISLLDIGGGGSCLYSATLLEVNPEARATQVDWPHINKAATRHLETKGLLDRFNSIDGDFHDVDFGENDFDVVVISNIIHQESPEQNLDLFRRAHRALKNNTKIIISDWIVEDGRTGPPPSLYFNLTMLLLTEEGKSYEKAELRKLLEQTGFSGITFDKTPAFETFCSATASKD